MSTVLALSIPALNWLLIFKAGVEPWLGVALASNVAYVIALAALLVAKPEAEGRLLAALVNKLGDPSRKVASNAAYLLGRVLQQHPMMKPLVVREVG